LFKEQCSIFFLSWNSYNAPIFIVPIGLAYQTIYQGVLIDLDSSFLNKSLPIIRTLFLNIFIFLNYLELGTTRRWRGAAPPCRAFLCRAQEARGLGRRHVPGCYWPAWPAMGDSLWERDIYRLDSFARCSLYVFRL